MTAYCDVGNNASDCEGSQIRTHCFSCGGYACKKCSRVRRYLHYGRRRICRDCALQWKLDKDE